MMYLGTLQCPELARCQTLKSKNQPGQMIFSMMSMFCFSSEITNLDVSNLFTVMDFLTRAFYVAAS